MGNEREIRCITMVLGLTKCGFYNKKYYSIIYSYLKSHTDRFTIHLPSTTRKFSKPQMTSESSAQTLHTHVESTLFYYFIYCTTMVISSME
jgi:hypothetical protein